MLSWFRSSRTASRRSAGDRQSGFSLGEVLVVVAIAGLAVAVAVPLVSESLRRAKVRGAADQFAISLKAARMVAVTKRQPTSVDILTAGAHAYSYPDAKGRVRTFQLPTGVTFQNVTVDPITFLADGSLAAASTTVLEANVVGSDVERWTVTTSVMGVPRITHKILTP